MMKSKVLLGTLLAFGLSFTAVSSLAGQCQREYKVYKYCKDSSECRKSKSLKKHYFNYKTCMTKALELDKKGSKESKPSCAKQWDAYQNCKKGY